MDNPINYWYQKYLALKAKMDEMMNGEEHLASVRKMSPNDLEEAGREYAFNNAEDGGEVVARCEGFVAGGIWQKEQKPNYCHHEVDETGWTEEYRKAYYDGWNNCNMQREQLKADQKPVEWSEEDETAFSDLMWCIEQASKSAKDENDMGNVWFAENWVKNRLKSLRPQPNKEIYQAAKHDLAIKFMNYLDENRPKGKMCLSNGECEDIDKAFKKNDWAKIMRYIEKYRPSWRPSEEQIEVLETAKRWYSDNMGCNPILESLYEQLKKLM